MSACGLSFDLSSKRRHRSLVPFMLFLLLLGLLCGAAQAQVLYGTLTGNVTDSSGAAVVGAKVEAQNLGTGVVQQDTSNASGVYRFITLQAGNYKITVTAPKFAKFVAENVRIDANNTRRVDSQLAVATQAETLMVSAEAPLLQADKADVHTDISAQQIESLPITSSQGRSFQSLYRVIPGFGLPTEANSAGGNPQRAMSANVNGQSIQGNNVRIDGSLNQYPWLPANIAYVPPADAIEAVNIVTNSFDAEQGNVGGAIVSVNIKSGTNQLHGSAHEFHTDNHLFAKDYFRAPKVADARTGQMVPNDLAKDIRNQYGYTLGGPIKKDKLFFFTDYERTTQRAYAQVKRSVPFGDALRGGDFRDVLAALNAKNPGKTYNIYDPNTGNPDGTGRQIVSCNGVQNVICANRFDPAAAKMVALIPQANLGNDGTGLNNYLATGVSAYTRNTMDAKVNYNPNSKATVFARYGISWSNIFDPPSLGAAGGDALAGGQPGNASGRIQTVGLGATYAFTPTLLADWNLGFTRQRINAENTDIDTNFGLDTLGIPGTNGPSHNQGGIPSFQFNSYSNLGNASTGNPFVFRDQQWVTNGNLSWMRGKHAFRFGIEMDRAAINHFQPQGGSFQTARGTFGFSSPGGTYATGLNAPVPDPANPGKFIQDPTLPNSAQYDSWAAFLLGTPVQVGKATQVLDPIAIRMSVWSFYMRDQFQVTPKLTLTYGVRWEYYPFAHSDKGRGVRLLDPTTMNVLIGGVGDVPLNDGVDVGHGQFLPRLGVAYRLTPKTVVRGGYGMSADSNNYRYVRNNYPSVINSVFTGVGGQAWAPAATLTPNRTFAPYPALTAGIPSFALPDISQARIPLADGTALGGSTILSPFKRGFINSYNLIVQREIAGFSAEAGYVGARAVHPLTNMNINPAPIGGGQSGRYLNTLFHHTTSDTCPTATNPTAKCAGWGDINAEVPFKWNRYDSLQTKLTRRLKGGTQFGAVYTFSKAINFSDNEELNFLLFPYQGYWDKAKGLASFDRTHNFQFYGLFNLPFGKGQRWATSGIPSALAGGWQMNWVFSRLSGTPFTITASNPAFLAPGNTETADVIAPITTPGCHINASPRPPECTYFSTSSFAAPTGARFGTGGRNIVRGPGFTNLDLSVFRNFKITERFTFQFRAEAFSVTNTPHLANPGVLNFGDTNFGVITGTIGGNSGTNLNGARQFWFAGKIIF